MGSLKGPEDVVNAPSPVPHLPGPPRRRWLLAAAGLATLLAVVFGQGNPVVAVAPAALALVAWGLFSLPLRHSIAVLLVVLLSVDCSSDAEGEWHSPIAFVGDLLISNLDAVIPAAKGFKVSGMEVLLLGMLAVNVFRQFLGRQSDALDRIATASIVRDFTLLYVAAVAYATVNGLATGGNMDIVIRHARPLLDVPLLILTLEVALRGREDHGLVARIVVLSACIKACLAAYVRLTVVSADGRVMEYTTNHGDSVLFAMACLILITPLMELPDRRKLTRCALLLPVIFMGMIANNRRVAWVELGFGLMAAYLLTPMRRRWKRELTRILIKAAPVALLYVGAGWSSNSTVFAPVRVVRSIVDTKRNRSSWNRQLENWNLAMSMRKRPIAGLGFGHEWTELFKQDDITNVFKMYHYVPHNQVLGMLLFMGVFGFTGVWALSCGTLLLGFRSYRRAEQPEDRAAALCCIASVLVLCAQAFGDLGPLWPQYKVCSALSCVIIGKLATLTRAWPPSSAGSAKV